MTGCHTHRLMGESAINVKNVPRELPGPMI
jgi:hypothetical protein